MAIKRHSQQGKEHHLSGCLMDSARVNRVDVSLNIIFVGHAMPPLQFRYAIIIRIPFISDGRQDRCCVGKLSRALNC
jgi:hypothetical protein